jgi:myo-inositol-1(or 4)-monophosphatase
MNLKRQKQALGTTIDAARAAGKLIRQNWHSIKMVNEESSHDIKLELDVRCQKLIEKKLHTALPHIALLGEEGVAGKADAECRWVVDPIDGTVNFAHGIPHACVSIALQRRMSGAKGQASGLARSRAAQLETQNSQHETLLGVVYDPFTDELWTAVRGQAARLNGKVIHVSRRKKLSEAIVAIGFAKNKDNMKKSLPYFTQLAPRCRKIRMMGSAALALTYTASGRFDAYIERGISLWDIAAGGLILECAGGEFWHEPISGEHKYRMVASNGLLRKQLRLGNLFS